MSKTLMVVDDSKIVYLSMVKMLEGTEFEIIHYCRSGEECVEAYESCHPDLVTMDIVMPGEDGLEAAKALLEKHPEARIIMVSSLAYDDTMDEAKKIGTKGFIYKPLQKENVLERLHKALES